MKAWKMIFFFNWVIFRLQPLITYHSWLENPPFVIPIGKEEFQLVMFDWGPKHDQKTCNNYRFSHNFGVEGGVPEKPLRFLGKVREPYRQHTLIRHQPVVNNPLMTRRWVCQIFFVFSHPETLGEDEYV